MKFHASRMPRVVYCPGSHQIESRYKGSKVWEAQEGTAAHAVGAQCLNANMEPVAFQGQTVQEFIVDAEMVRALTLYTSTCRGTLVPGSDTGVETKHLAEEQGNVLSCGVDFWSFDNVGHVLYVIDLKYGHGWVEVKENYQLLGYAVALLDAAIKTGYFPREIRLGIVQPRANHPDGPVRWWKFSGDLIRNYRNILFQSMGAATLENAPTITGPHCRYCNGLLHCHTMDKALGICMDVAGQSGDEIQDDDAQAWELKLINKTIKILEYKKVAIETAVFERLKAGGRAPGFETVNTWSALAWTGDAIAAGDLMGKDLRQDPKPITPTQAIDRGILTENAVKKLAKRKQTGLKLRPINLAQARRILKNG